LTEQADLETRPVLPVPYNRLPDHRQLFTLAHLSDPHLAGWALPGPGAIANKRAFGLLSWQFRRRWIHLPAVLEALIDDLRDAAPDHTVITGDVVNISLPHEFERATQWLSAFGPAEALTVIPGNHDAYIELPWESTIGRWRPYMQDEGTPETAGTTRFEGPDDFPFVRRRGRIAIVGTSSACAMPIGSAGGRLGGPQIDRLRQKLDELGREKLFRVVLIHHPPFVDRSHPRKELEDVAELRAAIAASGAELVLHGHTHRSSLNRIAVPDGTAPVIGVASASARAWGKKDPARYHLYRIEQSGSGWSVEVEVRSVAVGLDRFERTGGFRLEVPLAA
jgi:3',5'-cyclic AMP phosphodiesterase CpdA